MAEDRRRIAFWAAAARGTAIVTRWQSAEQRQQAATVIARAKQLREIHGPLRDRSAKLRERLADDRGDRLTIREGNRPTLR